METRKRDEESQQGTVTEVAHYYGSFYLQVVFMSSDLRLALVVIPILSILPVFWW